MYNIVNIGGGFGVHYTDEDKPIPFNEVSKFLINSVEAECLNNNVSIKKLVKGACYFEERDGFLFPYHYTKEQIEYLKDDVRQKYQRAEKTFEGVPQEDREFLQKFSFICLLSVDVYIKKMIIEKLIDDLKK